MVDYGLGRPTGNLSCDHVEIFGRDVESLRIVAHVAAFMIIPFEYLHEVIEEGALPIGAFERGRKFRKAKQIVVESHEKRLQLQDNQLIETSALGLLEIGVQQAEHSADNFRDDF